MRPSELWRELKDRRVVRVAVSYAVVVAVIVQAADLTLEPLGLPAWTYTLVLVIMIGGLPVALVLAWAFDVTPKGLVRADPMSEPALGSADRRVLESGARDVAEEKTPSALGEVTEASVESPRTVRDGSESEDGGRTRLVVLPFRSLRPDDETDFLTFSLPDSISCSLAALRSLVVRSSLTSLQFADSVPDPVSVARATGVDLILSGTVLREGVRLRVTSQLTEGETGTLLWSRTAEVPLGDLLDVQEEITQNMVASLRLSLSTSERRSLDANVPATALAYEYYLRANQIAYQTEQWRVARDLYRQSLEEDSEFAPAWARLGRCYRLISKYSLDEQVGRQQSALAEEAFRRALQIEPDLPSAVNLYAQLEVELGRAREALVRLIELVSKTGGDPELFAGLVTACRFCGLLRASRVAHQEARRLDPQVITTVGQTYWMLGDHDRSLQESNEDFGYLPALALVGLDRRDEAIRLLRERESRAGSTRVRPFLASLRALLEGHREESLAALDETTGDLFDGEAHYHLARSYAYLGAEGPARRGLARALAAGFFCYPRFASDPWLEPIRYDSEIAATIRQAREHHMLALDAYRSAGGDKILGESTSTTLEAQVRP